MKDITKMKKGELKELFIQQLITIRNLIQWSEDNKVPVIFGSLIIDSKYGENRSLINPDDYIHKVMKRDNYLYDIRNFQMLISELEKLKNEFEIRNLNQNIVENNETSNLNQSKRGGKRVGAGRKGFGETRKVSLTLPSEIWNMIEEMCEKGNLKQSKVLRDIIERGIKHP